MRQDAGSTRYAAHGKAKGPQKTQSSQKKAHSLIRFFAPFAFLCGLSALALVETTDFVIDGFYS
jgi:hypothetical protein